MLQAIRSKAGSLVVKILFAILIVAFGFWGVSSWLTGGGGDTAVATVGSDKIRAEQLSAAVRTQVEAMRQRYGGNIDMEQAKQLGVIDDQLDQLIDDSLVNQEVARLKLAVSDDAVRTMILSDPVFRDAAGQFDRARYQQLLANNRMTDAQYEASLRNQLMRGAVSDAVAAGVAAPRPLVDRFYRMLAEKRVADTVTIPFASITDIPEPSEKDLTDFHEQHAEGFRSPELRSFEVAYLTLDDLANTITIAEDELKDEYQRRADEFKTPERRHVEQILVQDQAIADQVEAALNSGQAFAAVAKDVAKMTSGPVDLGLVSAEELGEPALADAAFKLDKDGVSAPVKTDFGWHVLHVTEVQPAKTETFEEAKAKLRLELARDAADSDMGKLMNKVDDGLARGDDLDKVASDLQLKVAKLTDVDQAGRAAGGAEAAVPQPAAEILRAAFNTEAGQVSNVTETQDGGFFVVRVDKVTPSVVRPLAEVHDQAVTAWRQQQRIERATKLAKDIVDAVNAGKPLKDVAAEHKLTVTTTPQLDRGVAPAGLTLPVVTAIFTAKPHQAVQGATDGGITVAELTEVIAADPAADKPKVDAIAGQIRQQIQADLLSEYAGALHHIFPVDIDRARIDKLF